MRQAGTRIDLLIALVVVAFAGFTVVGCDSGRAEAEAACVASGPEMIGLVLSQDINAMFEARHPSAGTNLGREDLVQVALNLDDLGNVTTPGPDMDQARVDVRQGDAYCFYHYPFDSTKGPGHIELLFAQSEGEFGLLEIGIASAALGR